MPLLHGAQGSHRTLLQLLANEFGDEAVLVDGHPWHPHKLDATEPHDVEVEVARLADVVSAGHVREAVQQPSLPHNPQQNWVLTLPLLDGV